MFPAGAYRPTSGEWNWLHEAHNDTGYLRFYRAGEIPEEYPELAMGVGNWAGSPPVLFLRVWGGKDTSVGSATYVYNHARLKYNHWYDVLLHARWSPDPSVGFMEWWLDGKRLFSRHVADLWQRPDGSYDHLSFELNNYRLHANWNSTVYYSKTRIGPTQASTGF
jgi:hypothetical protein